MKTLIICLMMSGSLIAQSGTLQRAEPLTPAQVKALEEARAKVATANDELEKIEAKIAAEHQMASGDWMEWSSWVEFDGDFILYRHSTRYDLPVFSSPVPSCLIPCAHPQPAWAPAYFGGQHDIP